MLFNYSFQNFRSYRDAQQFTMECTRPAQDRDDAAWEHSDVPVVTGIYGSNASGKSAFLESLRFVVRFITQSFGGNIDLSEELHPFMLDDESRNRPTRFLVEFIGPYEGHYQYEFVVTSERVLFEELRKYSGARSSRIFLREYADDRDAYRYSYGRSFRGSKRAYESFTRPDVLMLSTLYATNCQPIEEAYQEFSGRFEYLDASDYGHELSLVKKELSEHTAMGSALQSIMASSGLGINAIEAKDALDLLYEAGGARDGSSAGEYRNFASRLSADRFELVFSHAGSNGYVGELFEQDESRGTRAVLALLSLVLRGLSCRSVVLIDEIDASLHPLYVEELVRLFLDPKTKPYQSQLIFTTNDVSLIGRSTDGNTVLDREQIWFVEKNACGESTLYPLSEIKSHSGEDFGRNYLNGVYGVIPRPSFHQAFADTVGLISGNSETAFEK